jgi:ketosteroid isomerase-like protein
MILRGLATCGLLLAVAGCGDSPNSSPDREQIENLVDDFFQDAAAKDVEAVCAVLTEDGWAHAVQRKFLVDEPLRSATHDDCIDERAPAALRSADLPGMVEYGYRPHLERLRILDDRATTRVRFNRLLARWSFRKTDAGWKIESFLFPVRE